MSAKTLSKSKARKLVSRLANGVTIYQGPSVIDGAPIVVVVTGLRNSSANGKTGDMLQTWILRQDVSPVDARKTGADVSICGACTLRDGTCYVVIFQAPRSVWEAWRRGRYPSGVSAAHALEMLSRHLRLGSYGDPAAVPFAALQALMAGRERGTWTGYTHQWREPWAQGLRLWCMASVETEEQLREAERLGWRCFVVQPKGSPLLDGARWCPSSRGVTCQACGQCDGIGGWELGSENRPHRQIEAHGAGAGRLAVVS